MKCFTHQKLKHNPVRDYSDHRQQRDFVSASCCQNTLESVTRVDTGSLQEKFSCWGYSRPPTATVSVLTENLHFLHPHIIIQITNLLEQWKKLYHWIWWFSAVACNVFHLFFVTRECFCFLPRKYEGTCTSTKHMLMGEGLNSEKLPSSRAAGSSSDFWWIQSPS